MILCYLYGIVNPPHRFRVSRLFSIGELAFTYDPPLRTRPPSSWNNLMKGILERVSFLFSSELGLLTEKELALVLIIFDSYALSGPGLPLSFPPPLFLFL